MKTQAPTSHMHFISFYMDNIFVLYVYNKNVVEYNDIYAESFVCILAIGFMLLAPVNPKRNRIE